MANKYQQSEQRRKPQPPEKLSKIMGRGFRHLSSVRGQIFPGFVKMFAVDYFGGDNPQVAVDPILCALIGKFGSTAIDPIFAERGWDDDHYTRDVVRSREQTVELLVRMIHGGLPQLHQRINQYPKLAAFLEKKYRIRQFYGDPASEGRAPVSVYPSLFEVVTTLSDKFATDAGEIAELLESFDL